MRMLSWCSKNGMQMTDAKESSRRPRVFARGAVVRAAWPPAELLDRLRPTMASRAKSCAADPRDRPAGHARGARQTVATFGRRNFAASCADGGVASPPSDGVGRRDGGQCPRYLGGEACRDPGAARERQRDRERERDLRRRIGRCTPRATRPACRDGQDLTGCRRTGCLTEGGIARASLRTHMAPWTSGGAP